MLQKAKNEDSEDGQVEPCSEQAEAVPPTLPDATLLAQFEEAFQGDGGELQGNKGSEEHEKTDGTSTSNSAGFLEADDKETTGSYPRLEPPTPSLLVDPPTETIESSAPEANMPTTGAVEAQPDEPEPPQAEAGRGEDHPEPVFRPKANAATQCSSDESEIPDLNDHSAQKPVPGKIRISEAAMQARLRRIMTPSVNGGHKISESIVKQWKARGKGRDSLEQLFQSVGYDKVGEVVRANGPKFFARFQKNWSSQFADYPQRDPGTFDCKKRCFTQLLLGFMLFFPGGEFRG